MKFNFNDIANAISIASGVTLAGIIQLFFLIIFTKKYYKPSIEFKIKI